MADKPNPGAYNPGAENNTRYAATPSKEPTTAKGNGEKVNPKPVEEVPTTQPFHEEAKKAVSGLDIGAEGNIALKGNPQPTTQPSQEYQATPLKEPATTRSSDPEEKPAPKPYYPSADVVGHSAPVATPTTQPAGTSKGNPSPAPTR